MEKLIEIGMWLKDNYINIFAILSSPVALAEVITRLTPTKKDDGFVERIGGFLRKAMDFCKIPNIKR